VGWEIGRGMYCAERRECGWGKKVEEKTQQMA